MCFSLCRASLPSSATSVFVDVQSARGDGADRAALPAAAGEVRFSRAAFRLRNFARRKSAAQLHRIHLGQRREHAKEVMVLWLGQTLLDRYRTLGNRCMKTIANWRCDARSGLSAFAVGDGFVYGCYAVIVGLAVSGKLSLGEMTLYVVAFRQGQQAFQKARSAVWVASTNTICTCPICSISWRFRRS